VITTLACESLKRSSILSIIEHWGFGTIEAPAPEALFPTSTYKTIRPAGDSIGRLYVMWCTGEAELYDIIERLRFINDEYPLPDKQTERPLWDDNLINLTDNRIKQTINRLNALVLYMKSCGASS
jgi:hypothetical protein